MDHLQSIVEPGKKFAKDSIRLVKKCTKPDRKEYQKIAFATAVGFAIMGFIGFFVKLIHIPINNILIMNEQPVVFCFSGKRKSGKDFICSRLQEQLNSRGFPTVIRGISYPLKEEYAQLNKLDAEKLKFDYEYKELVRKSMVEFGEQIRARDPHYFCRKTMEKIEEPTNFKFVLISDCRRPTDLEFFRQNYKNCLLVRVECKYEVRVQRGFVFTAGIDDQETECALDSFDNWDKCIENNGCLDLLDKQLNELVTEFC